MTFTQFVFNHAKRNTRAYLSYFLSCVFAVTVFFMYASVIFHPDIADTEFQVIVRSGVLFSEFIIYGFSFLFVLYSTSAFMRSRQKEYGLLTTLGMTKSQLNKMLVLENTVIGLAALITGLVIGSLFLKVFLMVFSYVLGIGKILPFYTSLQAIGITVILFFAMFVLNSFAVVWMLRTKSIMDVFRGNAAVPKEPRFSWILSMLSLAAIGYAYYLAYTADIMAIMLRMFPILALIIPGTYFLFAQFSILFVNAVKWHKHYYYHHLNLLTVSDLTYKLKDNARTLFFVTILSAVAFTSSGVLYGLFQSAATEAEQFIPQDASLVSRHGASRDTFKREVQKVEKQFHKEGIPFTSIQGNALEVKIFSNTGQWNDREEIIYPYSDYKNMMALKGEEAAFPEPADATYFLADDIMYPNLLTVPSPLLFTAGSVKKTLHTKTIREQIHITHPYGIYPIVAADDIFEQFYQGANEDRMLYTYVMHIPDWKKYTDETIAILNNADPDMVFADSKASFYTTMKETMSYLFFFGIFISVLFFLAAGSILYFRMYRGIDHDLHHYRSLYRIGLTGQEMEKIVTKQLGILFFIPFFIAVLHAGFAFKALQNMLASSVIIPSIIVISAYLIVHIANFIFIRRIYTAKLKKAMTYRDT